MAGGRISFCSLVEGRDGSIHFGTQVRLCGFLGHAVLDVVHDSGFDVICVSGGGISGSCGARLPCGILLRIAVLLN